MACTNPKSPEHRFARDAEIRTSRSIGTREIYTCNDCLSVKLTFTVHVPMSTSQLIRTVVVEQSEV
jgi:hypothetical protein